MITKLEEERLRMIEVACKKLLHDWNNDNNLGVVGTVLRIEKLLIPIDYWKEVPMGTDIITTKTRCNGKFIKYSDDIVTWLVSGKIKEISADEVTTKL